MQQRHEMGGRNRVFGVVRVSDLRRCAIGAAVIAGLAAMSACTSVAPASGGASQAPSSASGVTVYGTVDAGVSHTHR